MADLIQIRRDIASNWTSVNPTLAIGEFGLVMGSDGQFSGLYKVGNGTTTWSNLPAQYAIRGTGENSGQLIGFGADGAPVSLGVTIAQVTGSVSDVSSSLNSISGSINTRLDTLSGSVSALSSSVNTTISGSIAQLTTDLNALSSSVNTTISSSITNLSSSLNSLSGSVSSSISQLSSSMNTVISGTLVEMSQSIDALAQDISDNYARQDGYYSTLTAGAAENLVGQTVDSEAYLIRPTGGESNEVANGVASVICMEGNSVVWNQMVLSNLSKNEETQKNVTFSVSASRLSLQTTQEGIDGVGEVEIKNNYISEAFLGSRQITGHKYYSPNTLPRGFRFAENVLGGGYNLCGGRIQDGATITGHPSGQIWVLAGIGGTVVPNKVECPIMVFDLTAIFGSGNEPSTVAEFEAWLAEHVGTKPYYAYNPGTILSAQTLGIKTYGQNLLNPTTRQAKLIPYTWEENSNVYTIKNVPSEATATFTPDATGVAETVDISGGSLDITSYGRGILELSAATSETYVCMKWDEGKDDDVVPFEEHTQNFDVRKVYGKVNGAGEYVQCFPNGLRSAGSVRDDLKADKASVNIGSKMLNGTEGWYYTTVGSYNIPAFVMVLNDRATGINLLTPKYSTYRSLGSANIDKAITGYYHVYEKNICICDRSYDSSIDFANALSTNPLELLYELATPITYTDLIYRDGGIDTPITDVLFNIDVDNWSIEEQLLTPYDEDGCPTAVPATISTQYGMDAVEEIDTIKHTYVSAYNEQNFSEGQKAQARRNIGAVDENGTYPNMSVGIAKNLAGENAVEAEYTYRPSNGTIGTDTGIANVTDVKGETLVWNQLLKQGKLVDLGLPSGLLWATSNIDITQEDGFAASPFQYGCTMFSWGNIIGHNTPASGTTFDYNWGGVNAQEPWYEGQPYGETTGAALVTNIVAGDTQDAARYNLGSLFKMPTSTQFQELFDNCDFVQADGTTVIDSSVTDKRVTVNGIVGIYLKSKVNGNLIFFSASGYGNREEWYYKDSYGCYWSSSFYSSREANSLFFYSVVRPQNNNYRYYGFPVRAVVNPNTVDTGHNNHKYFVTKDINIDLTQMFGAGNEPSTVAEFEALYPLDYYNYNAGALVNNNASAIETTGFNQWDEEWEVGEYDVTTGEKKSGGTTIRCTNLVRVFPNTQYYCINKTTASANGTIAMFYNSDKTLITNIGSGRNYIGIGNTLFITPVNAAFMSFYTVGTTYNHDICINISDASRNGTYEPYEKHTFYFDKVLQGEGSLATIKGKLNGEGESVVVFPNGLKRVGNVYDEIKGNVAIKRIGSVDMGTLSWNASQSGIINTESITDRAIGHDNMLCALYEAVDVNNVVSMPDRSIRGYNSSIGLSIKDARYTTGEQLRTALNGVILYYELATPETYILDQTVTGGYQVNANGTERRLPEDTASSVNAPVNYSVIYPINAVGTLIKLPVNYISEKSLTNFTTELASKLGTFLSASINVSASYDSTDQEYDYSITITPNA